MGIRIEIIVFAGHFLRGKICLFSLFFIACISIYGLAAHFWFLFSLTSCHLWNKTMIKNISNNSLQIPRFLRSSFHFLSRLSILSNSLSTINFLIVITFVNENWPKLDSSPLPVIALPTDLLGQSIWLAKLGLNNYKNLSLGCSKNHFIWNFVVSYICIMALLQANWWIKRQFYLWVS